MISSLNVGYYIVEQEEINPMIITYIITPSDI